MKQRVEWLYDVNSVWCDAKCAENHQMFATEGQHVYVLTYAPLFYDYSTLRTYLSTGESAWFICEID